MEQFEQLNILKNSEKKDFILFQEDENKIPEYLKKDRKSNLWDIKSINSNLIDFKIVTSALSTLPWMARDSIIWNSTKEIWELRNNVNEKYFSSLIW